MTILTNRGGASLDEANDNFADDVLKGAEEIAAFLGEKPRAVFYAISKGRLPHYRIGESIRARKSALRQWIAEQEASARRSAV